MQNHCSGCGSSDFEVHIEPDEFHRNNQPYTANVESSVCCQCGVEVIFPEQIKRNDSVLRDIWRKMDTITHQELFGHLDNAIFTTSEAAEYLEVSIATFRRYLKANKITAITEVGSVHLYSLNALREFKKAFRMTKQKP